MLSLLRPVTRTIARTIVCTTLFVSPVILAQTPAPQPTSATDAPRRDTSYIDANGTAYITRVVPVPQDLSPEAQKFISPAVPDEAPPESLAKRRSHMDEWAVRSNAQWTKLCPIKPRTPNSAESRSSSSLPITCLLAIATRSS